MIWPASRINVENPPKPEIKKDSKNFKNDAAVRFVIAIPGSQGKSRLISRVKFASIVEEGNKTCKADILSTGVHPMTFDRRCWSGGISVESEQPWILLPGVSRKTPKCYRKMFTLGT